MKKIFILCAALVASFTTWAAVDVTFRVDMTNQSVSPFGVHIAGAFQGWNPGSTPLSDSNLDNIWEVTLSLTENTYYEYKFVNGNAWGSDENAIPGACNSFGNRYLTTGTANEIRPVYCFNECSFCASNPQFHAYTFQVDMQNVSVSPNGVHLAGSFGSTPAPHTAPNWDPAGIPMTDLDGDEIYSVTLTLAEGYYYEYKFINGNAWGSDESVPGACAVNNNRTCTCPVGAFVSPPVCFASCSACIASPDQYPVTFRVDMQNSSVSVNGVHLAGDFGSDGYPNWDPAGIAMSDVDADDVYEVTLLLTEGVYHEYKFINGNAWGSDEFVPGACASGLNRFFITPSAPTTLSEVCFASCSDCTPIATTYEVTFQVDMSISTVHVDGVHLAGSFGAVGYPNWNPSGIQMLDMDGDNVYSVTLDLPAGNYEYKFVNGNAWGLDESVPGECNVFGNRAYTVTGDAAIPVVCFAQCSACPPGPANDDRSGALLLNSTAVNSCNAQSGDLTYASVSPEANSFCVTGGHDLWYRFVAFEPGVRVVVTTNSSDVLLELQDGDQNTVAEENAVNGIGTEMLNFDGLSIGQTYYVAVRNYNTSSGTGSFAICVQRLSDSGCNYGPGPYSTCSVFKANSVFASSYTFTCTSTTTNAVYTNTVTGTTVTPLSFLPPNDTYTVTIDATYSLLNGAGATETIVIEDLESCSLIMGPHPDLDMRATDACPVIKYPYSIIGANQWLCGASYYEWRFYNPGQYVSPVAQVNGPAGSRYLNLISVTLPPNANGQYDVQVRPMYAGGTIAGDWGTDYQCLQLPIPAPMVLAGGEDQVQLERSVIATADDAALAIYPNPNRGEQLVVEIDGMEGPVRVRVADMTGRVVLNEQWTVRNGENRVVGFTSPLGDGLYVVEVTDGTTVLTQRLVVQQ